MDTRSAAVPWLTKGQGSCLCSQLRRASRAVTSIYDSFLKPAEMTVNQYAVLINVARKEGISRTELAKQLGMERTTLTRNLQPLLRQGWLKEDQGEDRRAQHLSLSPQGRRQLKKGYRCWVKAQQEFSVRLGEESAQNLLSMLAEATQAAGAKRS